jgi:hypothetical protein
LPQLRQSIGSPGWWSFWFVRSRLDLSPLGHEIGKGLKETRYFLGRFAGKGWLGLQFFVGLLEDVNVIHAKELFVRHYVPKGLHKAFKAVHTVVR